MPFQEIRNRALASVILLAGTGAAMAQTFPAKPIRLIIAAPAGGGADVIARPVAQKMAEAMGQQIIVDNRAGASGLIAGEMTQAAPPDGYTLLFVTASGFSLTPLLSRKPPYDPTRDFTPVSLVATAPLMVTVHPSLPVRSVKELIALAKARPGQLLYASNGQGSFSHLTTEMFSRAAGIEMTHVPYKGGTPAVIDTVSGQVQLVITAVPTLMGQVKAGRLRALAVTSAKRSAALPELPTVAEAGLPGFESIQWYAVFGPKNLPPAIVDRLYAELGKAVESPAVKAPLAQEGAELSVTGPQALAQFLATDVARWRKVLSGMNIVLE
jgi:tripartite-type tricarboxylate transporter receptor subunit TctC